MPTRAGFLLLLMVAFHVPIRAAEPIRRVLPPAGIEISSQDREKLLSRVGNLREQLGRYADHTLAPDVEVFIKAVELALHHGEFYRPKDIERANEVLDKAQERLQQLAAGTAIWSGARGRNVFGYRSIIDNSVQPYGIVVPDDTDLNKPAPLYVWLHGRGDTTTDMHFIWERMNRDGQIKPPGAIVLHPFGRHCLGFKSAGEIDVIETINRVKDTYHVDPNRIVLMGFSMGGAGTWHIGAHYTDQFAAISAGAGFVETARYTNLRQENYPPLYEQKLWGVYDVPNYTRNLFNRPVIAYSGELDKQIQAARVMEEAYREHGQTLPHLIGPGMGHAYHPETLKQLLQQIDQAVAKGRPETPKRVSFQTRTLRYNRLDWVEVRRLREHWQDSRVDAEIVGERRINVATKNVTDFALSPWKSMGGTEITLDGQAFVVPHNNEGGAEFVLVEKWDLLPRNATPPVHKKHRLQGPIDDVFLEPFLVVLPSQRSKNEQVQNWIDSELAHFQDRWRGVFRAELRSKKDVDVTSDDIARYSLVVWGTPESNAILGRAMQSAENQLPLQWTDEQLRLGNQSWSAATHIPLLIYPNPLNPGHYLVLNSGPTFREAHDRTNSLQNPKLPDWAIVDITQPPSASAPGRVLAADFFDEEWRVKR